MPQLVFQMSLATDSPVHSSSSGDFAAFLDAELDSISSDSSPNEEEVNDEFNSDSSDSSPNEEAENDSEIESQRYLGFFLSFKRLLKLYHGKILQFGTYFFLELDSSLLFVPCMYIRK